MRLLLAALLPLVQARALEVRPHPIVTERRLELTRRYCKTHYGLDSSELRDPRIIVIHATELKTLEGSFAAFAADALGADRKELAGGGRVNVGVHFLVDRNGGVYSLLPLNMIGRHAIGFNHVSIGIENVGFSDTLTAAQLDADAALVEDLVKRVPSVRYLIGHYEYVDKALPHFALFRDLDKSYRPTVKADPGRKFMARLRATLAAAGVKLSD